MPSVWRVGISNLGLGPAKDIRVRAHTTASGPCWFTLSIPGIVAGAMTEIDLVGGPDPFEDASEWDPEPLGVSRMLIEIRAKALNGEEMDVWRDRIYFYQAVLY